jgi:hypothetical protein
MSDSNQFGSAGTAVADPPAEETLAGSKGPKPVVLVAIVAGVLALAAAAYFLLFSGGGDDTATSGSVPPGQVSAPAGSHAPSASAKPSTSTAPQKVSTGGRDPFAPLVVPAGASGSGAPSTVSSSGSGTGTGTATVPSGLSESVTLTKVGLSPATVDVTVNGKKFTGQKVGQVFGTYFSMVAVTGSTTATLNFGDSSFTVVLGKTVTLHT